MAVTAGVELCVCDKSAGKNHPIRCANPQHDFDRIRKIVHELRSIQIYGDEMRLGTSAT